MKPGTITGLVLAVGVAGITIAMFLKLVTWLIAALIFTGVLFLAFEMGEIARKKNQTD